MWLQTEVGRPRDYWSQVATGGMQTQPKGCQQTPEAGKYKNRFSARPLARAWPCEHLHLLL